MPDHRCLLAPTARTRSDAVPVTILTALTETFSSSSAVPATRAPHPAARAAVSSSTTEQQHFLLSTVTFLSCSSSASHTRARLNPYLPMTEASDVRSSRSAVVSEKQRYAVSRNTWDPCFKLLRADSRISPSDPDAALTIARLVPVASARFLSRVGCTVIYSDGTASSMRCLLPQYHRGRTHRSKIPSVGSGCGFTTAHTWVGTYMRLRP